MSLKDSLKIKQENAPQPAETHNVVTPTLYEHLADLNGAFIPPEWSPKERGERKKKCLHPSSFSSCARALQYEWLGVESRRIIDAKLCLTFTIGHYVHKLLQTELARAGVLVADEVPVVNKRLMIYGHTDGLLQFADETYALLEIKTINPRDFKTLVIPSDDYLIQANCYLYCVEETRKALRRKVRKGEIDLKSLTSFQRIVHDIPHPLTQINFLYFCKGTNETKEFVIHRDEEIVEGIKEKAEEILDAMEDEELLPRISESPTEKPCAGCGYRWKCFDKFNSEDVDWSQV